VRILKLHDKILRRVVKSVLREQLLRDGYEVSRLTPDAMTV
jgi:hypothetical protein